LISVTKFAAKKLKEKIAEENLPEDTALRVVLHGYQRALPMMEIVLDDKITENDRVVESEGVKIVFEKEIEWYLLSAVIDYSTRWNDEGFRFKDGTVPSIDTI